MFEEEGAQISEEQTAIQNIDRKEDEELRTLDNAEQEVGHGSNKGGVERKDGNEILEPDGLDEAANMTMVKIMICIT